MDIRTRVVAFIKKGGSKAEAARRFEVSRSSIYDWLAMENLAPKKHGRRKRKLD